MKVSQHGSSIITIYRQNCLTRSSLKKKPPRPESPDGSEWLECDKDFCMNTYLKIKTPSLSELLSMDSPSPYVTLGDYLASDFYKNRFECLKDRLKPAPTN